jgi:cyclopropane fatty-acyl-phospholipid synthase-like methyltransferase
VSLQKKLVGQFHHPSGLLGHLAGWIMATRQSNLERNRWTVELLQLKSTDRVLELGPGPGVTLGLLLDQVSDGIVVGVDHSTTMLSRCRRRHRQAVQEHRLRLIQADFTDLPELPGPFDRIVAVNSLQFDGMSHETLNRIVNSLAPQGQFAVTFQPRGESPSRAKALAFAERLTQLLAATGLCDAHIEELPMMPVPAICVLARRGSSCSTFTPS